MDILKYITTLTPSFIRQKQAQILLVIQGIKNYRGTLDFDCFLGGNLAQIWIEIAELFYKFDLVLEEINSLHSVLKEKQINKLVVSIQQIF